MPCLPCDVVLDDHAEARSNDETSGGLDHGGSGDDTIDVSGDPSGEADFVNCDAGSDDTVIKDPGDTTLACEHVLP